MIINRKGVGEHINAVSSSTTILNKLWIPSGDTYLPIGGRIFLDNGDNGNTYEFFDSNKNPITGSTISDLASAVYYKVSGSSLVDRYYVYDTTGGTMANYGTFQTAEVLVGTQSAIGTGRANTEIMLARADRGTIFDAIAAKRNSNFGGCNDWYIGSKGEIEADINAGIGDHFGYVANIFSSTENDAAYGYVWSVNYWWWGARKKTRDGFFFAMRSF